MPQRLFARILASLILFQSVPAALAEDGLLSTSRKVNENISAGSVYYSGNYPGAVLMKVNLIGEVQRPGVHHVPVDADFTTILSFAGGPTRFGEVEDAVIKRRGPKGEEVVPVDLEKYFAEVHKSDFQIKPNDTLYIPRDKGIISDNTFRFLIVLSTIAGLVVSAIAIDNSIDN